ncbi:MAG TPA: hypothetical protein PLS20_01140 [Ruminococcus flavefaciens]|nr:hypothetical protein [Ruminococcus flavefaciens]
MKTTIAITMTESEKEQLFKVLDNMHLTVDEVIEQFFQWIIDNPIEAEKWLKSQLEGENETTKH